MPLLFERIVNDTAKLAVWHITEPESFFAEYVSVQREITHAHKRLQHLAGKYLLQYLYPDFPHQLILVADTRKPFLENDPYHFSISHSGDYAAAIVSQDQRVGVDVEVYSDKVNKIRDKFLSPTELLDLNPLELKDITALWSAKESIYKWYAHGSIDFKDDIRIEKMDSGVIKGRLLKVILQTFTVQYLHMDNIVLTYTSSKL